MSNNTTKHILITGGAGFIGSNFIIYFLNKYKDYNIINLDKLTYAADLNNLKEITNNKNDLNSRYKFIQGDILDKNLIHSIFENYNITDVIHFAAESHVDNSISGPEIFFQTNILGTFNLIDTAKQYWQKHNNYNNSRFHHISTDEVYGTLGETGYFTETTPYAPNSPYSASKASSDFVVRSYFHTYNMNTVTTNCSNNYGPRQHQEKLIPTIINKAINKQAIPIYGNGLNIRDWLYVEDHCTAIDLVFHQGLSGETYNIGSNNEKTNLEIVNTICEILNKIKPINNSENSGNFDYKNLITFVADRPGHDLRYAINPSKIINELNWQPKTEFTDGLYKTINWYLENNI